MREATAVIRNARRALRTANGQRKGRLHRAINGLNILVNVPNALWPKPVAGWPG